MPRTRISEFSATAADNTDIDSIDIAEGCAPSGINNAIRELMAQLKDFQTGAASDPFNGAVNGTLGATTPAAATVTSLTDSGNLTFTGTGNRITGDFSNATSANRVAFQSSTTNGNTAVNIAPNGTSTNASIIAFSDSAVGNSSFLQMRCDSTAEARFTSGAIGSGTALPMTFYTGGSEAMRITTDRNVGIGTTNAAPANGKGMSINGGSITRIDLRTSTSGDASGDGTSLQLNGNDFTIENRETGFVAIATSLQERMRIDSSGNLLVGTTSAAQDTLGIKLLSTGRLFATSASDAVFYRQSAGDPVIQFRSNNSSTNRLVATVEATGTYNTISDRSVKKNIENLTETLPQLMQILPVAFNWISDNDDSDKTIGFVAQDVENVYPQLITERDGQKMLNTTGFIPFLVKAIQEQQALIQNLTTRLTALEGN